MKNMLKSLTTPTRVAIFGSLIFAVFNLVLLGATYQRRTATNLLQEDIRTLQDNLVSLKQINDETLSSLREELAEIQEKIETLTASFPDPGSPFAIYSQGHVLAAESQMKLTSITLQGIDLKDTPSGPIEIKHYLLKLEGNLPNCITFLDRLEKAGQKTLVIDNISILPGEGVCEMEVQTAGFQK